MASITYSPGTSYARARLFVGMAGVGTFVVLAIGCWIGGFSDWLAASGETDFAIFATLFALYAIVSAPFDWLGGYILPRRYGRPTPDALDYAAGWLRGVGVQSAIMITCALALLEAGRLGGVAGATAAFVLAMVLLVAMQGWIARWVGGVQSAPVPSDSPLSRRNDVSLATSDDVGFTGGIHGLPGTERIVLPESWTRELPAWHLESIVRRRARVVASGHRTWGIVAAIAFNAIGFVLATTLPGAAVDSAAGIARIALATTLWSFLGLLLLPTPSRAAVHAADQAIDAADRTSFSALLRKLDRWQDDEPSRARWIERVFHPIPSVQSRIARLGETFTGPRTWHVARLALFLSWGCLGFLSRAVHCNAGRPSLWVYLPSD